MPCMGPDSRHARKKGKEAAKEILQLLQDKYHVMPSCRKSPFGHFANDKDRAIAQIVNGVIELLVLDAYESF